jgi:hypothetical protein
MIHPPTVMTVHNLALEKLLDGNRRYQVAKQVYPHQTAARRAPCATGKSHSLSFLAVPTLVCRQNWFSTKD